MPFIFAREAPKLWRKVCAETSTELSLLAGNWKFVLAGLIFQYLHGVAAHGVHYLHLPGPTLQDAGFFLLPELGQAKNYLSETLFAVIFSCFILWTFHPFVFQLKKIYTVLIWCRVFVYLAHLTGNHTREPLQFMNKECTTCVNFLNFHCVSNAPDHHLLLHSTSWSKPIVVRYNCLFQGSNLARLPPPESALEVLLINFPQGILYGCGDLIFSSHMIFTLVFVRTYQKYGTRRCFKQLAWSVAVVQSLLILASRKHYTVDVVVAWYTVNLVVFFIDQKLPELPDRSTSQPLLPMSTREKDSKSREELDKFLNGNSANITT